MMMNRTLTALLLSGVMAATVPAVAQDAEQNTATDGTTAAQGATENNGLVTVSLLEEVKAEKDKQSQSTVQASLSDVVKVGGTMKRVVDLAKVQVEGVAKTKPTPLGYDSEMVWRSVAIDVDDGAKKRKFLRKPLKSEARFKDTIKPGTEYKAEGDVASLLEDVKTLLAQQIEDVAEEAVEAAEEAEEEATSAAQGLSGTPGGSGGTTGQQYSPGLAQYSPSEQPELTPDTVYGTTTEGCDVRLSEDMTQVYEQSQVTEDGSPQGDCGDSGRTFNVSFSEASCPVEYIPEQGIAYRLFKAFYSSGAETRYLQKDNKDCFRHMDQYYEVQFNEAACPNVDPVVPEDGEIDVTVRGEPYVTRESGEYVRVAGCADIEDVQIAWITDNCPLVDDWKAKQTTQQEKAIYEFEGKTFTALSCVSRTLTYDHEKIDANCPVTVVGSGEEAQVFKGYDIVVTTTTGEQLRASCRVDDTSTNIVYNKDNCADIFYHGDTTSYGAVMKMFEDPDTGEMREISGCQRDDNDSYEQKVRTVSWRNEPLELQSYPMEETYIVTARGDRTVNMGESEIAQPYEFQTTSPNEAANEYFFEDCQKYEKTGTFDVYLRPDGEEYRRLVSEGAPLNHGNDCIETVVWDSANPSYSRNMTRGTETYTYTRENGGGIITGTATRDRYTCYSTRTETARYAVTRSTDGTVMESDEKTHSYSNTSSQHTNPCSYPGYPSSIPPLEKSDKEYIWWGV